MRKYSARSGAVARVLAHAFCRARAPRRCGLRRITCARPRSASGPWRRPASRMRRMNQASASWHSPGAGQYSVTAHLRLELGSPALLALETQRVDRGDRHFLQHRADEVAELPVVAARRQRHAVGPQADARRSRRYSPCARSTPEVRASSCSCSHFVGELVRRREEGIEPPQIVAAPRGVGSAGAPCAPSGARARGAAPWRRPRAGASVEK